MKFLLTVLLLVIASNTHAEKTPPALKIEAIEKNIYLHKSYQQTESFGLVSSNGLVFIDNANAFIIDTPWSERDTETLVDWIKAKGYKVLGSVSTHSHDDRTAGIKWLNTQSIPTYASKLTNQLLQKEGKALARYTIDKEVDWLIEGSIQAFYPGGGHTIDNIVIWLPKAKLLFGGCFVRSLGSKSLGYTGEATIDKWSASVEKVLAKYPEVKTVIPGHGKFGDIRLLTHTKKLAAASNKPVQEQRNTSIE